MRARASCRLPATLDATDSEETMPTLFYALGACSLAPHIALNGSGRPMTPSRSSMAPLSSLP
jgi:hypothetical protein